MLHCPTLVLVSCLLLVFLCVVRADGDDRACTAALDQLSVLSQRGRFTQLLDLYIRGHLTANAFNQSISNLISDSFDTALVQTPLGNTGPFNGKAAFVQWLVSLPTVTFDGFADHRLTNFIFDLVDSQCNPTQINQFNYAPNLLGIKFGTEHFLVSEVSSEQMLWVKQPAFGGVSQWRIKSYQVNSTALLDSAAIDINFYGPVL